jgi:hypothetical protein
LSSERFPLRTILGALPLSAFGYRPIVEKLGMPRDLSAARGKAAHRL